MVLLLGYLVILAVAFIATGNNLRSGLRESVAATIKRNSTRPDGSFSKRRKSIEQQSIDHACTQIYSGLLFVFAIGNVVLLLAIGVISQFDGSMEPGPYENSDYSSVLWATIVRVVDGWQWLILIVCVVSSIVILPGYISYLYQRALRTYSARANFRFHEYYRAQWYNENQRRQNLSHEHSQAS